MTEEEIEAERKREARKDRLHENYLRRKAKGEQQKMSDEAKAKQKAIITERKEALRAEDIAKGVFIPVCNLPKLEPRKGDIA